MSLLHNLAVLWLWLLAIAGVCMAGVDWMAHALSRSVGPVEVTWTKPRRVDDGC